MSRRDWSAYLADHEPTIGARVFLIGLLLLCAWWLDISDAAQAGYVPSRDQIIEDMNDKPVDSFPGQYAWDGMEWVDTSMEAQ